MRRRRIGVVGAGAAGLSAALALQDLGHAVTVFESEERPGGKCFSRPIGGVQADLGAVAIHPRGEIAKLARRMKRRIVEINHDHHPTLINRDFQPVYRGLSELASVAVDLMRLELLYRDWRRRDAIGQYRQDEDGISTLDYLSRHGLERLVPIIRAFLSGYGYGFIEATPASYFLAYYDFPRPFLYRIIPRCFQIEGGYEALWRDVASQLDVRYASSVLSVLRGDSPVIQTSEGAETFDSIVMACPPAALRDILDASEAERSLLNQVNHLCYHSLVFEGRGLAGCMMHLPFWCRPEDEGRPMLWYRPSRGGFCHTWTLAPHDASLENIEQRVRASAASLGGEIGATLAHKAWTYFPHFGIDAAGGRQAVRRWQGGGNAYFVGELFSFASVQHVVKHAQALMRASFGAVD